MLPLDSFLPQRSDLFDEFLPVATNAIILGGGILQAGSVGFLDSALDLIGDLLDPFVPGGAGSELRTGAFGGDVKRQNIARKAAGLPPLSGGRRARRRKALTDNDIKLMLTIASSVSKKAAENFMIVRTRGA